MLACSQPGYRPCTPSLLLSPLGGLQDGVPQAGAQVAPGQEPQCVGCSAVWLLPAAAAAGTGAAALLLLLLLLPCLLCSL